MAGHNKWSKIKRLKGALDVKCGKLFSRLSDEIVAANRLGGGCSSANPVCASFEGYRDHALAMHSNFFPKLSWPRRRTIEFRHD